MRILVMIITFSLIGQMRAYASNEVLSEAQMACYTQTYPGHNPSHEILKECSAIYKAWHKARQEEVDRKNKAYLEWLKKSDKHDLELIRKVYSKMGKE